MLSTTSVDIAHIRSLRKTAGHLAFWHAGITVCETRRDIDCMNLTSWTGWSYSYKGALAKAPKYQDLEGFDKQSNGLFRIHVHIDKLGFIWVNLDSSPTPTVSWEQDFKHVDCQPRLLNFNFDDYKFDHQWEMLGDYNWKTLADNYNEVSWSRSNGSCT